MSNTSRDDRAYYQLNERVFSKLAPFYDLVALPIRGLRRQAVILSGARPGSRVLDVATGTGAQAFAFAAAGCEVVGVDLSEAMLSVARRKCRGSNPTFRWADATELPFEDASFDVSSISFALHEMPLGIRSRVVREMVRVARPASVVLVVDYALPNNAVVGAAAYRAVKLYERDHYAQFVRSDLDALLRGAGLTIDEDRRPLGGLARIVRCTKSNEGGSP